MKITINIDECRAGAKTLIIEPWAEEFTLESGLIVEFEGQFNASSIVDVFVDGDFLIISAPSGATCRLIKGDFDLSGKVLSNPAP